MERIKKFRTAILDSYKDYAAYLRGTNYSSVDYHIVKDDENNRYQLEAPFSSIGLAGRQLPGFVHPRLDRRRR